MPNYRRMLVEGGTWFFTVNLANRGSSLLVNQIDALKAAIEGTQRRFPFKVDALVVLPDHLHTIWTLPEGDSDFSVRWAQIKIRFSKSRPDAETRSASRMKRGERGIWQRRFWEHMIRDERDFNDHVDYCRIDPVKHGLVPRAIDWPHSTIHRDYLPELANVDLGRALALHAERFGDRP